MKTTIISIALLVGSIFTSNAQGTTPPNASIAVATPSVQGLYITPTLATKILNLELVKLNQYRVYDEYDMAEILKSNPAFQSNCFGINCLSSLGTALKVDYVLSGSFDQLGNKIVVSLKMIDIKTSSVSKTALKEFDNQEAELQRMIEITIREMHGLTNEKELTERLSFKNEVITSNNVGKINNSGPRIGFAYLSGTINEFAVRDVSQGGLDIAPYVSMIGYQFEKQYVGTESFSALFETLINFTGLEQGKFMPSVALMNGFRFGNQGWEIAFGPSFGLKRVSNGFFDANGLYGNGYNAYWTESEYSTYHSNLYFDANPYTPGTNEYSTYNSNYEYSEPEYHIASTLDNRGSLKVSTRFVIGVGRTFKTGGLNIPVNVFYSSVQKGGMIGFSVGFNVLQKKENINKR